MRFKLKGRVAGVALAAVMAVGLVGTAGVALAEGDGGPPAGERPICHPGARHFAKRGFLQLAKASGLEREVIASGLKNGQSLAEIFEANGVETDEVLERVLADLEEMLDGKVEAGNLTGEQAEKIYQAAETRLPKLMEAQRPGPDRCGPRHPGLRREIARRELSIAASTIGIPLPELVEGLRSGETIADMAVAAGVEPEAVIEAMFEPVGDRIDRAVEAGRISPEKGDRLKDRALQKITRFVNEGKPHPETD